MIGRKTAVIISMILCFAIVPDAGAFAVTNSGQAPNTSDIAEQDIEQIQQDAADGSAYESTEVPEGTSPAAGSEQETQGGALTTQETQGRALATQETQGGALAEQDITMQSNGTQTTTKPSTTGKPVVKKLPVTARFRLSGWDTTFKNRVNRNANLPATTIPRSFLLNAKRKSIELRWIKPVAVGAIDGYIVLRKVGKSNRYYELKRLARSKTSYIDKSAKKKNTKYAYMIVGYKKGKIIRISPNATPWVVGYTTASKKIKNLYRTSIINARAVSTIRLGSAAVAVARVPSNTAHKYLRWYSGNSRIVTVNDRGRITAKGVGTTKISVRTATGRVTSMTIRVVKPAPRPGMLQVMQSWVGFSESNKKHRSIIDIYNTYLPHPRGFRMTYSAAWCDACISAAAIASGNAETVGVECGVPSHISIFKKKGIWIEDGTITPRPGDIIVFAWSRSKQPNNSSGSHIGIVESVSNGKITTIEGNYRDKVGKRTIKIGWGYIRGYARPNYVK